MTSFREYLQNHIVLFDGAMGTLIYQRGIFIDKCYDALNLTDPDLIRKIHQEYLDAGADVIETNTFGANQFKLTRHNLRDQTIEINRVGAEIAREVVQKDGYVAGSIGPLGIKIEPWGEISKKDARKAFKEQAQALLEGGVDLFSVETFQNIQEIEQAIIAVQYLCDLPIIAHMAIQDDGKTSYGTHLKEVVHYLTDLKVDGIGLNCALGPKRMLDFLETIVGCTNLPINIMPNAGQPQYVDGRMFYVTTPEYFGVYAKRLIETGARMIGGCCGTTPNHIQKMANSLAQKQTRIGKPVKITDTIEKTESLPEPVPMPQKSTLASKISDGRFVTMIEMVPPRGNTLSKQLEQASKLKKQGIDAINIPDGPRASARMNGSAMAVLIERVVGIETVLHYTCRDRNLLGMQSDLLGLSVLGIHNILAITGDPPMMGDYPEATAVFDIDSIGLTNLLNRLNHGMDLGKKAIGNSTQFLIGVGVDPNALNMKRELERFQWKVDAGAEYAITQPVFHVEALEIFLEKVTKSIPVIAGIWPLQSLRNAEFMKNEVPGVTIPDTILEKLSRFESKEDQQKAGLEIAIQMAEKVRSFTQGFQVSAPFGRYQIALDVASITEKT